MSPVSLVLSGMVALAAVCAIIVDHGLHRRSSQLLDSSVYCGPGGRRSVALTFDDGPGPETLQVLRFLQQQGISATFFQCGFKIELHPEIARQVHAAGHELANHGYSHVPLVPQFGPLFRFPSPRFMFRELARTQSLLSAICGEPPRLFRAPYGKRWIGLDAVRRHLGLIGVQWTVIGHDWEWPAARIAEHVLARAVPGAILCLHDGRDVHASADLSEMMAALKIIVPALRQRGYEFETVSELLDPLTASMPLTVA